MKTTALFVLLLAVLAAPQRVIGQQKKCLTFESLQEYRSKTPGAASDAAFETNLKSAITANAKNGALLSTYTIPVIFHILHQGEPIGTGQNLHAAQIREQLAQLNLDFANASGSKYGVAANTNIQFSLAVIDPQGRKLAEPGIERINRNGRGWQPPPYDVMGFENFMDATILPATIWNPYAYMNVWITELDDNVLGRATMPSLSGLNDMVNMGESDNHAGVLLDYRSVGSKTVPGAYGIWGGQGRTLTHETGHFLGLRHIWGDADCGNDYCGDTPQQKDFTNGCPGALTLTGCEPGINRMYENYMDYSYDNCVNTFTADQVARMQAVMLNSPRRKELATAGTDVAPAFNTVRFENVSFSFSENGVNTSACPAYREVQVNLNLFEAVQERATLQFSAFGTAQEGIDYELVTPTLTFNPGEATKTLVLRIYDDALAEGDEQIDLLYSINEGSIQAATENQQLTIDISDNDGVTAISNTGTITLLQEDFDGNGGLGNNSWRVGSFLSPAGANQWIFSPNGGAGFTGYSAHITGNATTGVNSYNTSSASNVLLISPLIKAKGISDVSLSFKYKCEGEVGADGYLRDYGMLYYSLDGTSFRPLQDVYGDYYLFYYTPSLEEFSENLSSVLGDKDFYLAFNWKNNNTAGSGKGLTIDDILVTSEALAVGQTAGEIAKQTVLTAQPALLKNTTSTEVIAKIENAAADLGCVTATITQAGSGLLPVTTNAGSFQRTQKVVQITPQRQTAATVTLYYTDAELAQWNDIKGILKVLKVKDGVALNGIISAANAEIITPTVTVNSAAGYTAYTFTVSSFSQFMLVSPSITLPVKLVRFEAKPQKEQIDLSWQTADEKENSGFWLERSINGAHFEKQAWIAANTSFNYKHIDRFVQPGIVYYYRLQQVDFSGKHTYSAIRQAKVESFGFVLQVVPNPATNNVKVYLSGSRQPVTLQLLNAAGIRVGEWQQTSISGAPVILNVAHLPKGVYTLLAITAGEIKSQKIIKQ